MIQKHNVTYLAESLTYSLKVCNANKSPSNILQCHVDGELRLYLLESVLQPVNNPDQKTFHSHVQWSNKKSSSLPTQILCNLNNDGDCYIYPSFVARKNLSSAHKWVKKSSKTFKDTQCCNAGENIAK